MFTKYRTFTPEVYSTKNSSFYSSQHTSDKIICGLGHFNGCQGEGVGLQ